MRYTVKDLLESGQFPEMKLISGESELNREIKGARLLEVANMECFLSGDEILFTSLKAYENVDLQEFVKHLEGLKKKQISAFIVKRDQQTELQRIRFNILLQYAKSQQIPVRNPKDVVLLGNYQAYFNSYLRYGNSKINIF